MRTLSRKLLRDLLRMKGQMAAISLIVACAVATWTATLVTWRGLRMSRDAYYSEYQVADLFAPVKKAPRHAAERLETVPGVRRVRPRIRFDVTLDLPEVREPCVGRILSLPDRDANPINGIHLTAGGWFTGDGDRQVIVGDRFAREHGLEPGDRILSILNNRKESLRIVGTALCPEYVYMIRGAGELLPDPKHFTVLWVSTTFAEAAFDFKDSANEFVALLDPHVSGKGVIAEFDRILDRYGCLGTFRLADHVSDRYLRNEIESLKGTATMIPTLFLGVAAFVLHMLLRRLVRTQRTQIALFMAFGYGAKALGRHYLRFALVTGIAGCLIGTGVGMWFAKEMLVSYQEFYQFPVLRFQLSPAIFASGVGVSLGFCLLGAFSAARRAARIHPAEGLRLEAPGIYRRTLLERIAPLWRRLGFVWRMVIRNVLRARRRSAFTVLGIALSASILLLAFFTEDSIRALMDFQYRHVERQDIRVTFNREKGRPALFELRHLEGVRRVEPELTVPVKLVNGHRSRRTGLVGLPAGGALHRIVDRDGYAVARPREGLVLSAKMAEILGVRPGDELEVRVLHGKKQVFRVPVERTVKEYIGTSGYADLHRLSRWIDEEEVFNGALLLVDHDRASAVTRRLKNLPAVESVVFTEQSRGIFEETLAEFMGIMTGVLVVFAGVISFGVIYNSSRITLAERERSLASLRILGCTRREVMQVISRENLLLAAASIPLGLFVGTLFCRAMVELYDTDLFRFPMALSRESLVKTGLGVLLFSALANLVMRRRIHRLDIVEALKARE